MLYESLVRRRHPEGKSASGPDPGDVWFERFRHDLPQPGVAKIVRVQLVRFRIEERQVVTVEDAILAQQEGEPRFLGTLCVEVKNSADPRRPLQRRPRGFDNEHLGVRECVAQPGHVLNHGPVNIAGVESAENTKSSAAIRELLFLRQTPPFTQDDSSPRPRTAETGAADITGTVCAARSDYRGDGHHPGYRILRSYPWVTFRSAIDSSLL